ncbi:DNA-binding response regulator [Aquabacterium sp.]|uniref:DNA-binding response regulator n=1 Tax=Aquabacterium sp. TaxID=1872578 RepID=UPI002CD60423|nr:DNA-binding response regulator [Aquabacterium sp.]HSW05867.1 DNA-binding response regulator [Aquabacterium sp.]
MSAALPASNDAPPGAARLLLIDDAPEQLRQLSSLLASQYRLLHATNGMTGFQRAQAQRPDLILLDLVMPGLDGHAVCRLLKSDAATRAIPVIFLSSRAAPEQRLEGLRLGAVDYIGKPFLAEEVRARIYVHLPRSAAPAEPRAGNDDGNPELALVHAAAQLLGEQLAALPSVGQLAEQLGLTERRLSTLFRKHLGLTVSGFISEERIRVGCQLLGSTQMSVQDIALEVGFANPANFSTAFRERLGLTPQAWRQHQRDGAAS